MPLMRFVKIPRVAQLLLREVGRLARQRGRSAYVVGGCVRDWMLGIRHVMDLDVTIEQEGLVVARALAEAFHGTVEIHEQFLTATVTLTRMPASIDVATCRKETYARPAAYPRVVSGTLRDDLFRRDFTINAMAAIISPERFGHMVDPFHGERDLRSHRLRVLHDRSFLDDPSRILRGVRFAQRFGCHWERKTQQLLRAAIAAGALAWLNEGRLVREFERMLKEPRPARCFQDLLRLLNGHS